MQLTGKQRRFLRGLVNRVEESVTVGAKGVTDSVVEEVKYALTRNELIKIRITKVEDKSFRKTCSAELAAKCDAEEVQVLGNTVVLYRRNEEAPQIKLPR